MIKYAIFIWVWVLVLLFLISGCGKSYCGQDPYLVGSKACECSFTPHELQACLNRANAGHKAGANGG